MKLFPIETLMEKMKPTFREKYVFDSKGKSIFVSTLGLLWLPAVWYQDQNDEFQSHNLLQNCGQFQPGAEGKIWWLRIQSGIIFNMKLHPMSKQFLGSLRLSAFWFEDQKIGFLKDSTSNSAKFFDWDPARRNQACSYEVMFIRLSKEIFIVYLSGDLRVSRLWCRVENWQFSSQTVHHVVEFSNWDLQRRELGLCLGRKLCLVLGKTLEW